MREHKGKQAEARLANADRWIAEDFVFCSEIGKPLDPKTVNDYLDAVLKLAELPHIRVHDLRHTTATLLTRMNAPSRYIMSIMGHAQIQQTIKYSHVLKSVGHEIAADMDKRLRPQATAS